MTTALKDAQEKVRDLSMKMLDVVESTSLTPAEQATSLKAFEKDLKHWQGEVASLDYVQKQREMLNSLAGQKGGDAAGTAATAAFGESIGAQFVKSAGYKRLLESGTVGKGGQWTTGDITIGTKDNVVGEGPGPLGTTPTGGAALVAQPNLLPGIVDIKTPDLVIGDLIPQAGTSSQLIRYLKETVLTNAAAMTAEGALFPESNIQFDKVDETVKKVTTFIPVTDEMLEDYEQIQGYLNARLSLFVRLQEQYQLLFGDGTGENLLGLMNQTGLQNEITIGTAPSLADDNAMDAVYRQITRIRVNSFMEPDAVVVDSVGWEGMTLAKTSQGIYYANGPFMSQAQPAVWGKKVVATPIMPENTALVGAYAAASQIFRKGGLTVEASNSHADYFQRGQTAIRAQERLVLAVYRPGAFGKVALTATGSGGAESA